MQLWHIATFQLIKILNVVLCSPKKDEIESNKKYLDNTIEVYGKISSMDLTSHLVVLDNKVIAVFEGKIPQNTKTSSVVKIKGRFIGYDNLLDELKIDQAMIINP